MAVLRATRGLERGVVSELESTPLLIGRNPHKCDIVLEHFAVSREHARIELLDGIWYLQDLHSRNGVLVNGVSLTPGPIGRTPLQLGDRIEIAAFELVYTDDSSLSDIEYVTDDTDTPEILTTIDCSEDSSRVVSMATEQGRLNALVGIIADLSRELKFNKVLEKVPSSLLRAFPNAQRGCVLLPDGNGEFLPTAICQPTGETDSIHVSRTILREITEQRQAVLSRNVADDSRFKTSSSVRELKLQSLIGAPLLNGNGGLLGVLQVEILEGDEQFTSEDLKLLIAIARHVAIVMENTRLHEQQLLAQRAEFETRFRAIVENSLQGIAIHRDFKPLFVNHAWAKLHGFTVEEVMQLENILVLIAPEEREEAQRQAALRMQGKQARTVYQAQHLRKDGSPVWLDKFTSVIDWDSQRVIYTAAIDTTKRKEAEAALQQAHDELEHRILERTKELEDAKSELERSNRDLEQFANSVSHDLQAPLRTVNSYCQLLKNRYQGQFDQDADEFLESIIAGSRRMKRLLDDLLQYSRVSTDTHPLQPTDFNNVLQEALHNLNIQIQETGAVVTSDPLPTVTADGTQLMQVMQNLIANAIKYRGPEPPVIHVHAVDDGDEWIFSVKDNGVGLDEKHFDRIFVIFQRLFAEHERPGTGVGLSICKRIVERHGGRIWVESEVGKGSTFFFSLPK